MTLHAKKKINIQPRGSFFKIDEKQSPLEIKYIE